LQSIVKQGAESGIFSEFIPHIINRRRANQDHQRKNTSAVIGGDDWQGWSA
jgi:hypothetical protein